MTTITSIILAAGKGTRLKSDIPKVLHKINDLPMIHHVINACKTANISEICLVVGYKKDDVLNACKSFNPKHCIQTEQLGTGHAVMCAMDIIQNSKSEQIIILAGDCPLIQPKTLSDLINVHETTNAAATLLTGKLGNAGSYGRIIRNSDNSIEAIREAKDCTKDQLTIREFNSGIYCFNRTELINSISKIKSNNSQNEYYLTDMIQILKEEGKIISGHCINTVYEVLGANTKEELDELNKTAKELFSSSKK